MMKLPLLRAAAIGAILTAPAALALPSTVPVGVRATDTPSYQASAAASQRAIAVCSGLWTGNQTSEQMEKHLLPLPADMKTEIDASRLLVWRAAWMARNRKQFTAAEGSMSKLKAGETAVRVTEQAVQILGGMGYVRETPVERWARDAKIYTIFEGTSEIQRLVIARAISGMYLT